MGYPELLSAAIFPELLASNHLVDNQDGTVVTMLHSPGCYRDYSHFHTCGKLFGTKYREW